MKKFKKIMALAIAMVMVLGMSTAVFAAPATSQTIDENSAANDQGKYIISVASDDTHTYTVYQILTGTLVAGESKLGNPVWGADATGETGTNTGVDAFITSITASGLSNAQVNALVEAQLASGATGQGTVTASQSLEVAPGYYLIKDTTTTLEDGDAYSLNIVAVFNDITITPKKGTTTSDKKVDDNDNDKADNGTEWIDSADYSIGDTVPYKLTATIADDSANYTKGYKLTFHDVMSAGLTFNSSSVVVKVGTTTIATENYELVTEPTDGCTFEVKFANLKDISAVTAGSVITVEFNATLNSSAVIGVPGNPNTSHVTYTNNPNDAQAGENGKTPDDKVIVFTYETVFNKVDSQNKPLTGADFTLYKKVGENWVDVTALHTGEGAQNPSKTVANLTNDNGTATNAKFTFAGLDAGDYKLVETTTPTGYNTIADITFTITAEHQILSDNPQLTSLIGAEGTTFTMTTVKEGEGEGEDATPTGELDADIQNQQGTELPSTGGIGTTIFYVIGAILVLGAGILLVTRRRMNAN